MHNYYTILRISEDATTEEIKSAYRALAKEYHPDINPNNSIAEEYFKKINEAYSVLKDPIKRNWYNLLLKGNIMFQPTDPRKYGTRNKYPASSTSTETNNEPQETTTQYRLQQLVLFLSMLWSLLIIYNNWFVSFEGNEMIKMVFAFLLFIVSAYFYINNLYNKWRDKSNNFNPESRSLKYFIFLFFFTIPAFFAIGIARKSFHMKLYPVITEAKVIEYRQRFDDYWVSIIYFDEKNLAYKKDFNFRSNISMRSNYKIFVKYSTLEPRIMEYYIRLTGKDTIHQLEIDEMNKGNAYFKPTN